MDQISITEQVGTTATPVKAGAKAHGHKPAVNLFDQLMTTTVSSVTEAPVAITANSDAKPTEAPIDPAVLSLLPPEFSEAVAGEGPVAAPTLEAADVEVTLPQVAVTVPEGYAEAELPHDLIETIQTEQTAIVAKEGTHAVAVKTPQVKLNDQADVPVAAEVVANPSQTPIAPLAAPNVSADAASSNDVEPTEMVETIKVEIEAPEVDAPEVAVIAPHVMPKPEAKADVAKDTSERPVEVDQTNTSEPQIVAAPVTAAVVQTATPAPKAAPITSAVSVKPAASDRAAKTASQTSAPATPIETTAPKAESNEVKATQPEPKANPTPQQPVVPTITRDHATPLADMPDQVTIDTATPMPQAAAAPIEVQQSIEAMTEAVTELPSVDTTQDTWVDTLSTQIEMAFTETGGEAEIALTPENLGAIRIRMEMRDGAAHVVIVTETTDAARLFNQNEGRLSEMLSKSGVTLTGQDAGTDPRRDQNAQRGQGQTFANGRTETNSNETTDGMAKTAKVGARLVNLIA